MVVPSKNSKTTEKLLYRYGKLLGLSPFSLDEFQVFKFSYIGLIYGITISTIFSWIFYKSMEHRVGTKLPGETTMAMLTNCWADILEFASMFATWMIFALRQKKILTIAELFVGTSVTASKLGIIESERDQFFKKLGMHVLLVNISFLTFVVIDHAHLFLTIDYKDPVYFVVFNAAHVVCRNLIILFLNSLLLIRGRFARLNETTRNLGITRRGVRDDRTSRNGCVRGASFSGYSDSQISSLPERIEIVGQLHRELTDLAEMIRDFCSPPLLIIITMHFIQLVSNCYVAMLSIFGYRSMDWQDFVSLIMVIIWLAMNLIEPLVITDVCHSTCSEAHRTATVLHEMSNECGTMTASYSRVIEMVSLSLLQNQLNMTLYGFFNLDPELMYKIGGTTTTYVLIIMQLDQQSNIYTNHPLRSSYFH